MSTLLLTINNYYVKVSTKGEKTQNSVYVVCTRPLVTDRWRYVL